jgi:Cof subfamily protein (haloacid dehalogenase superfamily)
MKSKVNGTSIRALCTDIDGTLLDNRRELSPYTNAVIRKISKSIPIVLASSRMPGAMRHLQKELDILRHPLICYNGGYVLQYDAHEKPGILYSATIPVDICGAILNLANDTSLHVSLYVNDEWYAPGMDEWTHREATITKVSPVIKPGEEVLNAWQQTNTGAHKVMCMGHAGEIKVLETALREKFANEIHVYHSKSTYLEIAPKVISKASALKFLLQNLYGIEMDDVIAFGDNYNDIELLQTVGLGIAVSNARDEVKAVANEITGDSKQDGVAHAIQKHLLDGRHTPE